MTRLAIIAGQGNLPLQVAKAAAHKGYDVFSSYSRVDAVYKSLEKFLINPIRFESLLPRLQANQQRWLDIRDDFDTYGGPPPYE